LSRTGWIDPVELIPAVDVLDGRVVRLLQGSYEKATTYGTDPVEAAARWIEAGARIVHVVDLAGARQGRPEMGLWSALGEAGLTFQAGGGIRNAGLARKVLELGARRVVMGTAAVWSPESLVGLGEAVVAAVDVRSGRATGQGWTDEGRPVDEVLADLNGAGVRRLLVTGIGRDGTMAGPDLDLTRSLIEDGRFSVIASGGVASLADLDLLAALGCEGVVVGRALYEGRFGLAEALARLDS
jgi:phosphoribosylformimino-5-aminoimidazole carboxamide ribotide isomerase